jgi:uncharacterized protein YbjT (DUF2867 family)
MSPRIFIVGASGYIGGHVLRALSISHPNYHLVVLVRSIDHAKLVKAQYPAAEIAIGDLDSHMLLLEQGKKANIVLRNSPL